MPIPAAYYADVMRATAPHDSRCEDGYLFYCKYGDHNFRSEGPKVNFCYEHNAVCSWATECICLELEALA